MLTPSKKAYTYGSIPNLPAQKKQSKILRADRQFMTWCFIVSLCLCFFSFLFIAFPRTAELSHSQRNLQILAALKDSTSLAQNTNSAFDPHAGTIIPNVVGCMQTNCMGELQAVWKGGDSKSQGVMKCMNTFTGDDQQTCLAKQHDNPSAGRILDCGMCNNCYNGSDKPDDCSDFQNSDWNNNIPDSYKGWMNSGGAKQGSAKQGSDSSQYFDYSKYMNGGGSGNGFDYSKYMNGEGYSQYMNGAGDYSKWMQGHGADAMGDEPSTLAMVLAALDDISADATSDDSADATSDNSADATVDDSTTDAQTSTDDSSKATITDSGSSKYSRNLGKDDYDYSKYSDYSKYMSGGGGGGGGGGKDYVQDIVGKMMREGKTSTDIGDYFKKQYAGKYLKKYGGATKTAGNSGDATKSAGDSGDATDDDAATDATKSSDTDATDDAEATTDDSAVTADSAATADDDTSKADDTNAADTSKSDETSADDAKAADDVSNADDTKASDKQQQ